MRVVEEEREEFGREFFFQAVLAGAQGGGREEEALGLRLRGATEGVEGAEQQVLFGELGNVVLHVEHDIDKRVGDVGDDFGALGG